MDSTYTIPTELVHTAIYGICGTLVAVCCYMVIWALNDAKWKTTVITRLASLENLVKRHDDHRDRLNQQDVKIGVLEKANADDDRYRVEHDKLMTKVDALDSWRREHIHKHTCD